MISDCCLIILPLRSQQDPEQEVVQELRSFRPDSSRDSVRGTITAPWRFHWRTTRVQGFFSPLFVFAPLKLVAMVTSLACGLFSCLRVFSTDVLTFLWKHQTNSFRNEPSALKCVFARMFLRKWVVPLRGRMGGDQEMMEKEKLMTA